MSKFFIAVAVLFAALSVGGALLAVDTFLPSGFASGSGEKTLVVNNIPLTVSVADTPVRRTQGLSGVPVLKENEGMLFVYDREGVYSFWMKDMRFPIDIIWVGSDAKVVDVTENARPESFPSLFEPKEPARFIIEVNAGWASKNKVAAGTPISGIY